MKCRWRAPRVWTAALLLAVGASGCSAPPPSGSPPERVGTEALSLTSGGAVTGSADSTRSGWYPDEGLLAPATVTGGTFKQLWSTAITGEVYAEPLVSGNTVFVATETNNLYAIDATTGSIQASSALGTPWNPQDLACSDLTPSIGVTGTPVIDANTNIAYFFSKTYVSGTSGTAEWLAHAVSVTTLQEQPGFPVVISGTAANDPTVTFDAKHEHQRPGLLLLNGVVYAAFGAHCDAKNYDGWIVAVSTGGVIESMWSTETGSGSVGAGIWQSGSGIVSDGAGRIFFTTGNGKSFLTPSVGTNVPGQLGEAVVRLNVQSNGTLQPADYFMASDADHLNSTDGDLGSGGPVALPDSFGTTAVPHLMVQVGKEGYLYLLNRDNLGGFQQASGNADAVVSRIGPNGGLWGRPGVWGGGGGYVYYVANQGAMAAFSRGVDGSGNPTLSLAGKTSDSFGFGSSLPVITSNGTTSGSALVWVVMSPSGSGANATLNAYNPIPSGGTLSRVFSAPVGTASKFTAPAVASGRIYVGTRDGHLVAFGSPVTAPLKSGPLDFGTVVDGQSATQSITLTANEAVTVNSFSSSDPEFTVTSTSVTLPASLNTGDTMTVNVAFAPTATGALSGTLTVNTSAGAQTFPMSGTGASATASLALSPTSLSFAGTPVGQTITGTFTIGNQGAQPLNVTGLTLPIAPFSVTGLPALNASIGTGQSVTATVTFSPTATGTFPGTFSITTNGGNGSVTLSGIGATQGQLVLSTTEASAGNVVVGSTGNATFSISNSGGSTVTITKSKSPTSSAFKVLQDIPEGTTIAPGGQVTAVVQFAPTALGLVQDSWTIDGTDGLGVRTVGFDGTGVNGIPGPAAGGWTLNGSSTLSSGTLILTPASSYKAGTAFWPTAVSPQGLTIAFDLFIGGGSGADGLALVFADPSSGAKPTSLGVNGGGLGFSGIPGIALAFDTYQNGVNPGNNFVGVSNGPVSGNTGELKWLASATNIPTLKGSTHHAVVTVNAGTLSVSLDGTSYLNASVSLPSQALIGFSAGTGGLTDQHAVSNVSITTPLTDGGTAGGGDAAADAPTDAPSETGSGAGDAGADTGSGGSDAAPETGTGGADAGVDAGGGGHDASAETGGTVDGGGAIDASGPAFWQLNGKTKTTASGIQLTSAGAYQAGTAFWTQPYSSSYISATFDVNIGGGSGADGLALVFANPSAGATPTSLGVNGGGLAFSGIPGIAVAFDTYQNGGNPGKNFIGVSDGPKTGNTGQLHWTASTTNIPTIRGTVHHAVVTLNAGALSVSFDGANVLSTTVSLPSQVLVGFSGSTGGLTDNHEADNISIATLPVDGGASSSGGGVDAAVDVAAEASADAGSGGGDAAADTTSGGSSSGGVGGGDGGSDAGSSGTSSGGVGGSDSGTSDSGGIVDSGAADTSGAGSWRLNGSATTTANGFLLTDTGANEAGSVFWTQQYASSALSAAFDVTIGGGSGADGLAIVFADPSGASPTSLGVSGGGLGFSGIPGIAVAFDTYQNGGNPSSNFIGISNGPAQGSTTELNWLTFTSSIANLRAGSHHVIVTLNAGTLQVGFDGSLALSWAVTLPSQVLVGFTAGTGGFTDNHEVDNVSIVTQVVDAGVAGGGSGSGDGGVDATIDATIDATVDAGVDATDAGAADTSGTGSWQLNGSTTAVSTGFQLTDTGANEAGSVFWTQPYSSSTLTATFDISIGGGSGADGMAIVFADPSSGGTPTSLGVSGGGLGFSGIPGIAVAFDTYQNGVNPSANFIGVSDGPLSGMTNELHWLANASPSASLRSGTHHVVVTLSAGVLGVDLDGTAVLSTTVTLPANVLVGFTGGTGGLTDTHVAENISIQ